MKPLDIHEIAKRMKCSAGFRDWICLYYKAPSAELRGDLIQMLENDEAPTEERPRYFNQVKIWCTDLTLPRALSGDSKAFLRAMKELDRLDEQVLALALQPTDYGRTRLSELAELGIGSVFKAHTLHFEPMRFDQSTRLMIVGGTG